MAWLATDKSEEEYIYSEMPYREGDCFLAEQNIHLPKGSIEKLIGTKLTWENEPLEI